MLITGFGLKRAKSKYWSYPEERHIPRYKPRNILNQKTRFGDCKENVRDLWKSKKVHPLCLDRGFNRQ